MRSVRTLRTSLLAAVLVVVALAAPVLRNEHASSAASAAPSPTTDTAPARPEAPAGKVTHPKLTANTNAPCNHKPQKKHEVQCLAVVRTPSDHVITPDAAGPPPTALGPADIQDAYKLPIDKGVGQTVATVIWGDDANAEADLAVFRSQYGLPPCTTDNGCFSKVNQNGEQGSYPPDQGTGIETSLDLDAISAACPLCHILLVEADGPTLDPLAAAEDKAVELGAKFVSNSWGAGDTGFPGGADTHFDHPGVAIVASSGDNANVVDWPSSIPTVTSAGGTRLVRDSSVSRGWVEKVCDWGHDDCEASSTGPRSNTGSGCSSVEPKPDYQNGVDGLDAVCPENRATADIAADADPHSGLAVYDGNDGNGWLQVGGTSLSSPLLAGMYALAGTPVPGTHPVTYPYQAAGSGLFDVTEGEPNGSCGNVLCTPGPGWDGPTGIGTPNGVDALRTGPHGNITGTVTDAGSGDPIAGVTVSTSNGYTTTTDEDGHYTFGVLVGSYDVTAHTYGYADKTQTGVQVTDGDTTTVDFALQKAPTTTVSGTVTDASGHGWPLHAKITIDDYPGKPVYTDPFTGRYSVDLAGQHTYTFHITALGPGYQDKQMAVQVDTTDVQQNIALVVDPSTCSAPGYAKDSGSCAPVPGGLVAGVVSDANTGDPLNDATVASTVNPDESATTAGTDDPNVPGGFYALFSTHTGSTELAVSSPAYQTATAVVEVASDTVTRRDWSLGAGHLSITPSSVAASLTLGQSTARKVTLTNDGAAPVQVSLGTQDGTFTPAGQPTERQSAEQPATAPAGSAWEDVASYPIPIVNNAAAYDPQNGKVYSVGGLTTDNTNIHATSKGYVYDPSANIWSPIASEPEALWGQAAGFVDGTLYLVGGFTHATDPPGTAVYAYTPSVGRWSKVASLPAGVVHAMTAVLGGQLYVVGGSCKSSFSCTHTSDTVYRYDPGSNTWTTLASYPIPVSFGACAGLDGQVVCTGGWGGHALSATYLYNPVTDTWNQGASIPSVRGVGFSGMSYAAANGKLQIANGGTTTTGGSATNEAQQYDPVTNTWSLLPNTNHAGTQGGGACGFYVIGGGVIGAESSVQVLPGYDQCGGDTSWLAVKGDTKVTVPAGQSMTVTVRLNAAKVDQPGTYTAALWATTDSPYPVQTAPVTMQVDSPPAWQKIAGTVTGPDGDPLARATVTYKQLSSDQARPSAVRTDADGTYVWWLPAGRIQVSAAKDYYQPQARIVTLGRDAPATVDFTLKADPATSVDNTQSPHASATTGNRPVPGDRADAADRAVTATASSNKKGTTTTSRPRAGLTTSKNALCNTTPEKGHARCLAVIHTSLTGEVAADAQDPPPTALGPADIQDAYDLPDGGAGQTVAIVDAYGYSTAESDLAVFRDYYNLPPCTSDNGCFTKLDQRGGTDYPPDNTGWATETALDLDAVSAACPKCHILLVEGDDTSLGSLGTAVDTAVRLGAKYVSNSYGLSTGEDPGQTDFDHYYDHPGVAVVAASGDTGNEVSWPSSNPHVVSAGGTRLTRDGSTARGWTEKPWTGGGSGCSQYEPKPDYQSGNGVETQCDHRATADIAADADPASGLGIYDTLGQGGWLQVGGTSLASPLVAAMYALAGTPVAGTYPVTYPYDPTRSAGLNDITEGSNGSCGNVLCEAGPGWDGPTGMGTPHGVSALRGAPHGTITGTVTDEQSGDPIAGVTVSTAEGYTATTGEDGHYSLGGVRVGSYEVSAHTYGYADKTQTGVQVTDGGTATVDFALQQVASHTVSGTVTDGSGHGWPLYAKITIDGYPGKPVYTDPFTGRYSVDLAGQHTYTFHVTPTYPGYATPAVTVDVGTAAVRHDITVPVARLACLQAPGYATTGGAYTDFTGWTGTAAEGRWTNVDNNSASDWAFGDPPLDWILSNPIGTGGFAIATPLRSASLADQDTSLVSPVFSLAGIASPKISFNTAYAVVGGSSSYDISVDLSVDGGSTWQSVWQQSGTEYGQGAAGLVTIPVPQAAGKTDVQVRFHFTGTNSALWGLDNIQVGTPACTPVPGGLVAGVVSDANTSQPVNGATVVRPGEAAQSGTSVASGDPALPGGFYWLFSPHTGATELTATDAPYAKSTATVEVAADAVTRKDWVLQAGQLAADATDLSATETLGGTRTVKFTVRNSGGAPLHLGFGVQDGGFTPRDPGPRRITGSQLTAGDWQTAASTSSWTGIADYPTAIVNNAVAYDRQTGRIYSVGGQTGGFGRFGQSVGRCGPTGRAYGQTTSGYVYDPHAQAWQPIAPLPEPLESPAATFLSGTLYVVGGFDCDDQASAAVYAYTPGSNTWAHAASLPSGAVAPAIAVLDGQLYVVGGCRTTFCGDRNVKASRAVYRYDPAGDDWTKLADYPVLGGVSFLACAGIDGEVVCAGGLGVGGTYWPILNATYIYDPASNTWTQGADMPYHAFQMAYSGSGGKLQVAGGVTLKSRPSQRGIDRVSQYDPVTNTWSALPNLPGPEWGGGGACGMYVIGGRDGSSSVSAAQVLPGYDQCDGAGDTGWLSASPSSTDLAPGDSVTVTVTMDSSTVLQPGTYLATLYASTNTPYRVRTLPVTMRVDPPSSWGLLRGTVTAAGSGDPITGATVQLCSNYTTHRGTCGPVTYTVKTDANGKFQWWLDTRYNTLQAIAAEDGYIQQVRAVRFKRGKATAIDFALPKFVPGPHALQNRPRRDSHPGGRGTMPRQ